MKHLKSTTIIRGSTLVVMMTLVGSLANPVGAEIIRVEYEALAKTVVGQPFGLTVPLDTPVTGYFQYNTDTQDTNSSPTSGTYVHESDGDFVANFLGHQVRGSATPTWTVTQADTLRIFDGPRDISFEGGVMSFDASPNHEIQLFFAITPSDDGLLPNDDLPNPWPAFDFGFLGDPHTFTLSSSTNETHTMLLQITSAQQVGITTIACSLAPNAATNIVGDIHSVTSTVTSNNVPLSGFTVHFHITDGPGAGSTAEDVTDINGAAVFTYTNNGTAGLDTISATGSVDSVSFSCSADKLWVPPSADLSVLKSDSPDPVTLGSNITYTLTIFNGGPSPATDVTVTDTLPASVTFVSASTGCVAVGNTVVCDLGGLDSGSSTNLSIVVAPNFTGLITNTVTVGGNETDLISTNNSAVAVTGVTLPLPDLTVAITNADFTCTNTTKRAVCSSAGTMTLANNGEDYGSATFTITGTKQEKSGKPPKWKIAALLDVIAFDLGAHPASLIQIHLSDDTTLDSSDTPLLKKPIRTAALDAAAGSGKSVKVSIKAPKGVDLSGKRLIIEVDAIDPKTGDRAVDETDEDNNTTLIGPIP